MKVHIRLLGVINRPVMGLSRFFYHYFMEAANGAIAEEFDEDYIEDGDYELPDKDWTYDENEDYGEDLVDEQDLLGRTIA